MDYKIIDTTPSEDGLRRVMANNRYGIINDNNQLICDIDYEAIELPDRYNSTTHIMVEKNGKWTSIDKFGNNRITLQMDGYGDFFKTNPKYAVVKVNGQICIIDRFGNIITGYRFYNCCIEDIELFGEKFAFFFTQEETRITAYDIETKRCPDFWIQIYNIHGWVTNVLVRKKDSSDNLLYRTTSKEYTIDKKGNILEIEPLPFKLRASGFFAKHILMPIVRQEMKREKGK